MKQLFLLLLATSSFAMLASAQNSKTKTKKEDKTAAQASYPYTAEYSSQFEIGNPAHGKMILELWKDWDDNELDRHADFFADTIVMESPTGELTKGKETILANGKKYRGMFSDVKSSIEVWIPLRSIDKNENWVAIWGKEQDTDKDGKTTTKMLHEVWRINKDGKVDFMRQYEAKPTIQ